jgi:hypothetical protein
MTREGGGSGLEAKPKPYDGEKASSSINNSIFSELTYLVEVPLLWCLLLVHRNPDWLQLGHLLLHHPNHQQTNKTIRVVISEQISPAPLPYDLMPLKCHSAVYTFQLLICDTSFLNIDFIV